MNARERATEYIDKQIENGRAFGPSEVDPLKRLQAIEDVTKSIERYECLYLAAQEQETRAK